jgi:hypothetical protein
VKVKLLGGSIRQALARSGNEQVETGLIIAIGIEKAQSNGVFRDMVPQMMLCGTDDLVPGIKNNGGHLSVVERAGLGLDIIA